MRRFFARRFFGYAPGWIALILVLGGTALATSPVFNGSVYVPAGGRLSSPVLVPLAVPTPNSSSTIIGYGDSTTYGAYGPTACVAAANQPASVASGSLTGTCWLDRIGAYYGASVIDLAIGGTTLRNDGTLNAASGITRLTTSYTCPAQSASPTDASAGNNCKGGAVIPSLESVVNANTFVYIAYNGINDASNAPNTVDYAGALTDYNAIVAGIEANGVPSNHIIFVGAPSGYKSNGYYPQYLGYTAAEAQASLSAGAAFVPLWTATATDPNYSTDYYDTIHPNDSGSALWATTIENVNGLGPIAATAYQVLGGMYVNTRFPQFDTSNNLTLPSGSRVSVSSWYDVNQADMFGGDGANTLVKACCSGNTIYFQTSAGANIAHFTANSLTIDAAGGGITTPGITDSGGLNMTGSTPAYITFGAKDEIGYDGSNTLIRACCSGNTTYFLDASANNVAHFTATAFIMDASGGIQPNGSSGGYTPEYEPLGVKSTHPVVITGECSVTQPSTACTFPGTFAFSGTTYTCTVTPEGTTAAAVSYAKTSTTQITLYTATTATYSYQCSL